MCVPIRTINPVICNILGCAEGRLFKCIWIQNPAFPLILWNFVWILTSGLDFRCHSVLTNEIETMPALKGRYENIVSAKQCLAHSNEHAMKANSFYFVFLRFCLGDQDVDF